MIAVEDIEKLVGKRVVSDTSGVLGTIVEITKDRNPIKVRFDNGNEVAYDKTGGYHTTTIPYYISLVDAEISAILSGTMATYGISPEELIAIVLERYCE